MLFNVKVAHMYKAEGPTIDARNADTTPEPLPTSKHTHGLINSKEKYTDYKIQRSYPRLLKEMCEGKK